MPKASRNVPLVAAISVMRSRPRAVSTRATIGTFGSRLAVSVTWSTDSTIASITPPSDNLPKASRSSAHHGVPNPLTRTQSLLPSLSHRITLSRALNLSFGATASSMSSTTMSARDAAAGAKRSYCAPLTNSQLRASTGSMRDPVAGIRCSAVAWSSISSWLRTGPGAPLPGSAEVGSAEERLHGVPVPLRGRGVIRGIVGTANPCPAS